MEGLGFFCLSILAGEASLDKVTLMILSEKLRVRLMCALVFSHVIYIEGPCDLSAKAVGLLSFLVCSPIITDPASS